MHTLISTAAIVCLIAPLGLGAQQCIGLPGRFALSVTALGNTQNPSRTTSIGGSAALRNVPLFLAVEGGRIEANVALLTTAGTFGNLVVGADRRSGRAHPCVALARGSGSGPTTAGGTGRSLAATSALIGVGYDLARRGDAVAAAVFGSWQYSAPDNGLAGGLARAGILYAPIRHGFVRTAFDYATTAPHTSAVSISIGAHWR